MPTTQPQVEYVTNSRIGEKGQITIPKQYRDELGLDAGASVAVLRVGEGLMLIPEQNRFRILCESIASVFERRQVTPTDLVDTLPGARQRVFARRYPELAGHEGGETRRSKGR
jgi:AbrB family looped-hinge helix DNA binding protein